MKVKKGKRRIGYGRTFDFEPENRLREFRVEVGLSQVQLLEKSGVKASQERLSNLEQGKIGAIHHRTGIVKPWIAKICEVLGKSFGEVFPREVCEFSRNELTDEQMIDITIGHPAMPENPNILKAIKTLGLREQEVLMLRYYEDKTLEEVGEILGITRERVRQIEAIAFRQLLHPTRRKLLLPVS